MGDSILNNVNEKLLSNKKRLVKVYSLSGATTDDLKEFVKPLAHTKPGRIILRCGTNDLREVQGISPDTRVIFSSLMLRLDSDESKSKIVKVNAQLKSICERKNIELVDTNITKRGLGVKGLHLNMSGTSRLALNFKSVLTKV